MLARLFRSVFGGGSTDPRSSSEPPSPQPSRGMFGMRQAAPTKVRVEDIFSVSSIPLRALFEDRYRQPVTDNAVAGEQAKAVFEAAFADPMPMAVELLLRAPLMTALLRTGTTAELRRLGMLFDNALDDVRRRCVSQFGHDLPITDGKLVLLLSAAGVMVAQGATDPHWGRGLWLETLVRTAAGRQDPTVRRALAKMFSDCFGGEAHNHDAVKRLVEKLLALSGLDRSEIPQLSAADDDDARLNAARAAIFADAGEPLAAAIAAILDQETGRYLRTLRDFEKHPAIRALADLSPEARGHAFHRLLDIILGLSARGVDRWGVLEQERGRYRRGINHSLYLPGLGGILGTLGTRKIVLKDGDRDVARFLQLLPHFPQLGYKKLLELALETARAHPQGETVARLKELAKPDGSHHAFRSWMTDIEDLLRDLPSPAEAIAPADAPASRSPAGPGGFGRKGQGGAQGEAPREGLAVAASPLKGLAPISLPAFILDDFRTADAIGRHFDNVLEARLYDAPHRDFLGALDALATEIGGMVEEDRRVRANRVIGAAKAKRFALKGDHDATRAAHGIERAAGLGSELHQRFSAFVPFIGQYPEEARALGRIAGDIASKSAPAAKWLEQARAAIAGLSTDQRLDMIDALVDTPALNSGEAYLRALLYISADLDPARIGPRLSEYALKKCYVTQPGVGIRAEKLGNACLWTLAAMPDGAGVPYLARILARTKYPKIKARIDAKLNEAAEAAGISRAALDELTVPTHDLDRDGMVRMPLGDGEAVLRVKGARDAAIEWVGGSGKLLKAPSVAMKADKDVLKAVREAAKELTADLSIQPVRLQRLYLENRRWPAEEWRSRYLDHPLVRTLSRRLIWWVEDADGRSTAALPDVAGAALCDLSGSPIALDHATIRLWHPIDADVADVIAWRDRLEALQVVQPFAQVWREVYALTDAERATGTYSNRWAAHILRQHQAMTLARINGWRVTHRMWVDAANDEPWHLTLPAHGIVVDYWVEGAGGDDPEVSDSGAYAFVATDRVQFHEVVADAADSARGPARGRAVPLDQLPAIVFSEVMRQADLFTAVTSIAADPNWLDRGGDAPHPSQWGQRAADYWTRTNTAALAESGLRRRAILERIVPRLKIADKLSFEDRYLRVAGTRHDYRIHLGSGACFRGERHICIVPKGGEGGERIWLPFEGDQTLSIIISKAILLAADNKITDPVILRQL